MHSFSRFVSLVFHPILLPTYMAGIIIWANPILFSQFPSLLMLVIALLTIGFPLFAITLMKWLGMISSFEMNDSKERFIPLIAVATFWMWAFFMLKPGGSTITASHSILSNMLLGSVLSIFIAFPLNSLMKVSFHTIAMGGLVGMFINIVGVAEMNLVPFLLVAILLAGFIGTVRLYLKAHSQMEVFVGLFIGFFCQFLAYGFYDKLAHLFQF